MPDIAGPVRLVFTIAGLLLAAREAMAAPSYQCVVDGTVTYQQAPCPSGVVRARPTVQELNAAEAKRRAAKSATTVESPAPPTPRESGAFRCDRRTYCSQMKSCDEAKYFLANCPAVKLDGDRDGIPCEKQWCGR